MYKEILIISRVINDNWIMKIPQNQHLCSFRELATMIDYKNSDVIVKKTEDLHCWLSPNVLLYDRPSLEWCNKDVYNSSLFLLGNCDVENEGKRVHQKTNVPVKPWIFWPKYPRLIENILKTYPLLKYSERQIKSIFIGNIENNVQHTYRQHFADQWSEAVDLFECVYGKSHKYNPIEYLNHIRNSRYGLCIRGYGSKCHREIELMAFGTVPIVTEDVNTSSYQEPLVENKHFFKVDSPTQLKKIIKKYK